VMIGELTTEAVQLGDAGQQALGAQFAVAAFRLWQGSDLAKQDPALYGALIALSSTPLPQAPLTGTPLAVFAPSGHLLAVYTGGESGTVQFFDVTNPGHPRPLYTKQLDDVTSLAVSPDDRVLAIGFTTGEVQLQDIADPRAPERLITDPAHSSTDLTEFIGFTGTDTLVVWRIDRTTVYDIAGTGPPRPEGGLTVDGNVAQVLAVDPVGHRLVATYQAGERWIVRVVDVRDPHDPRLLPAPVIPYLNADQATAALGGQLLAMFPASSSGGVGLWSMPDGRMIHTVQTVNSAATNTPLALDQRGDMLAMIAGNQLHLSPQNGTGPRPAPTGQAVDIPGTVGDSVLALSPDGTLAATVSTSGNFPPRLLELSVPAAVNAVCRSPSLTEPEWEKYVPELPYTPPCPGDSHG